MHNELFIPKTITVGCQKRSDTYTGELAYIIYTDAKGVLRKEKSWQGWRDQSIEPRKFNNEPFSGFTFNKGVQRDGHWGSGRSMIRVWDPRGFEFEISIDNLIGLLMHSDVSKRDVVEPCVYAWHGTELILLPTNSVEYAESVKFTDKQDMKIKANELGIGYTYELKTSKTQVVYLGRLQTYGFKETASPRGRYYVTHRTQVDKKKQHVFINPVSKQIEFKSPTAYLAQVLSEEMHPQFAEFMDAFYHEHTSQPIVSVYVLPTTVLDKEDEQDVEDALDEGEAYDEETGDLLPVVAEEAHKSFNTVLYKLQSYREYIEVAPNNFAHIHIKLELFKHYWPENADRVPPEVEVEFSTAVVFDPALRELRYSLDAVNHHYYGRDGSEGVTLPEVNAGTPAVRELVANIKADIYAALRDFKKLPYSGAQMTPELATTLKGLEAVHAKYKQGKLQYVLQDGQIYSKDI